MLLLVWFLLFVLSCIAINWVEKKFCNIAKLETGKETLSERMKTILVLASVGTVLLLGMALITLLKLLLWIF